MWSTSALAPSSGLGIDDWDGISHRTPQISTSKPTPAVDDGIPADELAPTPLVFPAHGMRVCGDCRQAAWASKTCEIPDSTGSQCGPAEQLLFAGAQGDFDIEPPSRPPQEDVLRRRRTVPRSALRLESRIALAESAAPVPKIYGGDGQPLTSDSFVEGRGSDILQAATTFIAKTSQSGGRPETPSEQPSALQSLRYPRLEGAARWIAEERLARVGYLPSCWVPQIPQRSRSLSTSSSETRAEEINAEMRKLHQITSATDQKKEGCDTLLLMTIARKNVEDRRLRRGHRIADQRGLIGREDWDGVTTEIAQKRSGIRPQDLGRIGPGCGACMSQEEMDAIAERNVRSVVDDINERARLESCIEGEQCAREQDTQMEAERDKRAAAFREAAHKEAEEEPKKVEAQHENRRQRSRRKAREGNVLDEDTGLMLVARGPQTPPREGNRDAPTLSVDGHQDRSRTTQTTPAQHCPESDFDREVPVRGQPGVLNNELKQASENVRTKSPRVKHTRSFSAMGLLQSDRLRRLSEQTSGMDESSAGRHGGMRSTLTGLFDSTGKARRRNTHLTEQGPSSRHGLLSRIYHSFGKHRSGNDAPLRPLDSEAPAAAPLQRSKHSFRHSLAQSGPILTSRPGRNEPPTPNSTDADAFARRHGSTTPSKGKGIMRVFKRGGADGPTPTSPIAAVSPRASELRSEDGFRASVEGRTVDEEGRLKRVSVVNSGTRGSRFIEDL